MKLVEIIWEDAHGYDDWNYGVNDPDVHFVPLMTRSVGFLYEKRSDVVVLVQTHNDNDDVTGILIIPVSCITSITTLVSGPKMRI